MEVDESVELSIDLAEIPRGQDSPVTEYDIDVVELEARYLGPIGKGRRGNYERKFVPYDLTDEQCERLGELLVEHDLCQSVSVTYSVDGDEPFLDEIDATATVTVDGERHELSFEGPMYDASEPTDMPHHEQAEGLRTLCETFKDWTETAAEGTLW
jgi:hypothetical protein